MINVQRILGILFYFLSVTISFKIKKYNMIYYQSFLVTYIFGHVYIIEACIEESTGERGNVLWTLHI